MFINRTWNLDEDTDFKTNVKPKLGKFDGAIPVFDVENAIIGWKIKNIWE